MAKKKANDDLIFRSQPRPSRKVSDQKITGKNREAAKFMGVPLDHFEDPGFCLLCGESQCECEG